MLAEHIYREVCV